MLEHEERHRITRLASKRIKMGMPAASSAFQNIICTIIIFCSSICDHYIIIYLVVSGIWVDLTSYNYYFIFMTGDRILKVRKGYRFVITKVERLVLKYIA